MVESKFKRERWVEIDFQTNLSHSKYEVSNMGRVKSYAKDKEGRIIKGSNISGYKSMMVRFRDKENRVVTQQHYIHRLVAEAFIKKSKKDQHYVIHLDYDKQNNAVYNLKWATEEELIAHNNKNPLVLKKRVTGYKLTENDVKVIKKLLKSQKTRLSMIAKRFGITHTQLNRIRSGENWGHVTID
ncbi:NUMOD4 domain-containing protein [Xanthovirga aplysinae]|uniref:NUMOD4 domain-containing protein n=1 Tax=Xanthovirga aplysinae TaxID=2529853 RepID=UPI0012BB7F9C|nr:NUMOD4 domain-containing protein [Xanthovirga aplysinae]MTI32311.1 hypothetical protein [Xanthovirga aplysinae]